MTTQQIITEINNAIGAHGAWKLKLRTAINRQKSDVTPFEAGCDNNCAFGKWLYSNGIDQTMRRGKPYQVIRRLHAEFHDSAGRVLELALKGEKAAAEELMDGELRPRTEKLMLALSKWKRELNRLARSAA